VSLAFLWTFTGHPWWGVAFRKTHIPQGFPVNNLLRRYS
jgi:hypothetical protein